MGEAMAEFLERAPQDKPFCLSDSFNVPHGSQALSMGLEWNMKSPANENPALKGTTNVLGMITAEVTEDGLKDIRTVPLPGHSRAPKAPEWQLRAFKRQDLVQRMIEAGKLLKISQAPLS